MGWKSRIDWDGQENRVEVGYEGDTEGQTSRTRHFSRHRDRLSSSGSSRHEQGQS